MFAFYLFTGLHSTLSAQQNIALTANVDATVYVGPNAQILGNAVTAMITFEGTSFPKAKALVDYDSGFQGNLVEAKLTIPQRIFDQLEKRKELWQVDYTEDDKVAPWLNPSNLLLYIQVAEPFNIFQDTIRNNGEIIRMIPRMIPLAKEKYSITIDGQNYEVKEAYNGVYPYVSRTHQGMYTDISSLKPDKEYSIKVKVPKGLEPGQFQGLFIEHVEDEYSHKLSRK
jgi:hypothetical protein